MKRPTLMCVCLFFLGCVPVPSGVTVLGNSITASGDTVASMQDELGDRQVFNAGCGFATTYTWLFEDVVPHEGFACDAALTNGGAFEPLARPVLPDTHVVFIHLGVNDSRFHASCFNGYNPCYADPVEPAEYRDNLRALIAKIDAETGTVYLAVESYPIVVLVKPPLIDCQAVTCVLKHHFANARIVDYGREIEAICDDDPAVLCGPDLKDVMLPEHYDAGDGVHPNLAGYQAIAAAYLEFMSAEGL